MSAKIMACLTHYLVDIIIISTKKFFYVKATECSNIKADTKIGL